jgi:hypothetical protein
VTMERTALPVSTNTLSRVDVRTKAPDSPKAQSVSVRGGAVRDALLKICGAIPQHRRNFGSARSYEVRWSSSPIRFDRAFQI